MIDLATLNSQQKKAVTTITGPVLVIAGAGTGKTHVITTRIAYLINECAIAPQKILAITFTKKAAEEMVNRVKKKINTKNLRWICTYHGLCYRILKMEINHFGWDQKFTVIDAEEQTTIIKNILKSENIVLPSSLKPRNIVAKIKHIKKNIDGIVDDNYQDLGHLLGNTYDEQFVKIFMKIVTSYSNYLKKNNYLDFDDLINFTYSLLKNHQDVRLKWQENFDYILVDEFQDTDYKQFMIIKYLTNPNHNNIFVVGDQNQTIYTWRGAYAKIFDEFANWQKKYKKISLSINYRSTKKILAAANALIWHNGEKFGTMLSATNKNNFDIECFIGIDTSDEANYIIEKINHLHINDGLPYDKIMILYRLNRSSRAIENSLIKSQIPYIIYGGFQFYQRTEIKDLIAYLRAIYFNDELSYLRIINVPKRRIGDETIEKINKWAKHNKSTFVEVLNKIDQVETINETIKGKVKIFLQTIISLRKKIETNPPQQAIKIIVDEIKYFSYLKQEYREYDERYENIKELQQAINDFFNKKEGNFIDFLNEINLYMSSPKENKTQGVKLMTIHFAKGKESDCVFIFDFNNGIIPHSSSYATSNFIDDDQEEEERRIAYVGITRAINHLYLTCSSCNESPYLNEIGKQNYKIITSEINLHPQPKINSFLSQEMYHKTFPQFEIGEIIVHDFFGQGTIIAKKNLDIVVQFNPPHGKQTLKSNHKAIKKLIN